MTTNEDILKEKVMRIIQKKIRPALHIHGGDIVLMDIADRNVKVRFEGACCSCPSMQSTMDDIVTTTLKEELGDEINRVILCNDLSDELMDYARNFFKNKQE